MGSASTLTSGGPRSAEPAPERCVSVRGGGPTKAQGQARRLGRPASQSAPSVFPRHSGVRPDRRGEKVSAAREPGIPSTRRPSAAGLRGGRRRQKDPRGARHSGKLERRPVRPRPRGSRASARPFTSSTAWATAIGCGPATTSLNASAVTAEIHTKIEAMASAHPGHAPQHLRADAGSFHALHHRERTPEARDCSHTLHCMTNSD